MDLFRKWSQNCLSSPRWYIQVCGALIKSKAIVAAVLIFSVYIIMYGFTFVPPDFVVSPNVMGICVSVVVFGLVSYVVSNLNKVYNLHKEETKITWSQIVLLASFGITVGMVVYFLDIDKDNNPNAYMLLTIAGAVMGWIFQDTIKSVVAFFYLRSNGLLNIGDWIEVDGHGINGIVKYITLTTVQIENWDTTTSAFPVYVLFSEHFRNKQRMLEGRTHGRLMKRTFIIDTGWVHSVTNEEVNEIREKLEADECFKNTVIRAGELNILLFRRYIYHWLMRHPHISQKPHLFVTWKEHTSQGMPLLVYAFIIDSKWEAYEWQLSAITEHIIKSVEAFNLQLYQDPSGYDTINNSIYLTNRQANYRKT